MLELDELSEELRKGKLVVAYNKPGPRGKVLFSGRIRVVDDYRLWNRLQKRPKNEDDDLDMEEDHDDEENENIREKKKTIDFEF